MTIEEIQSDRAEYRQARDEFDRVFLLNTETRKINAAIRRENEKIEAEAKRIIMAATEANYATAIRAADALTATRKSTLPLPYTLSSRSAASLAVEKCAQEYLRRTKPETWAERIAELPPSIRTEVANIIWWDWFGGRMSSDRWPHLDFYIGQRVGDPDRLELMNALISLGYTPNRAHDRLDNREAPVKHKKAA